MSCGTGEVRQRLAMMTTRTSVSAAPVMPAIVTAPPHMYNKVRVLPIFSCAQTAWAPGLRSPLRQAFIFGSPETAPATRSTFVVQHRE